MTIDLPVFNEDGSVKTTLNINEKEAQHLLQFAINFLSAAGLASNVSVSQEDDVQWPTELND